MKIQCDVCNKDEAAVFCSADEAALCAACDHRVHHANKLAGKHQRFSLLHPNSKHVPLCDICQEKRAFLFCQQHRAILCKDCDIPIHKANEHTQNHNRFLLTGVKISATSSLYLPSSSATSSATSLNNKKDSNIVPNLKPANPPIMATNSEKVLSNDTNNQLTSVSQYLMEMPGWHVEDLLSSASPASFGLCKSGEDLAIWDADLASNLTSISSENIGIWVPQAPTPLYPIQYPSTNISFGSQISYKEKEINTKKSNKNRRNDSFFHVPQIVHPSSASKRSRHYWLQNREKDGLLPGLKSSGPKF